MISVAMTKKRRDFDPRTFLATIVEGSKFVLLPKNQAIFFCAGETAHVVANQKVLSPDSKRLPGMRSDNVGARRQR
jgi:hypothetical protein